MDLEHFSAFIDIQEPTFLKALLVVFLAPFIWNILARIEFHTHLLTKLACNNKYLGCYALATWIFCFSFYRDYVFARAMDKQPKLNLENGVYLDYLGYGLLGVGGTLVLSSMYQLGITGTYLGDYFGILMDAKVSSFPFNVMNNPMYDGACLNFLGLAILERSIAGILLTAWIFVIYRIALMFEGPFTNYIYQLKEERERKKQK